MKPHKLVRAAVLTFILLLVAMVAYVKADVAPPVVIKMPHDTLQAVSGTEYLGVFDIYIVKAGTLADFKLEGEGWAILSFDAPTDPCLAYEGVLAIPFRALPEDANRPIHLSLTHDGELVSKAYELGPNYFARVKKASSVQSDGASLIETFSEPLLKEASHYPTPSNGAIPLQFRGRFVYIRSDGRIVGVDNILVEVMDDDGASDDDLVDETIWSAYTDVNGYFDSGIIWWDDCDIAGCDEPDIYVRFECDTPVGQVQESGILEEDYSWSTMDNIHENFTGSGIDFGIIQPHDAGEMPALHIWNSLVRTHRYIKKAIGLDTDHVDIQWPESDDRAWYEEFFDEIHIGPSYQWKEGTHSHEYGHHFMANHSINQSIDYCNGYCDFETGVPGCYDTPATKCTHCAWCEEVSPGSWNEGVPNWLAGTLLRSYPRDYRFDDCTPYIPLDSRSYHENIAKCCQDDQWHDPWLTEGFVSALLRDIDDQPDLAHDDNDDDNEEWAQTTDCMSLGPEEILTVVTQDQPETLEQFFTKFMSRYPQHTPALWKTAQNVHPAYLSEFPADTAPPGPVTALHSATHPSGVGGALPCITVEFEQPTDDVTGSKGFSVDWTTNPGGTVPVESINWYGSCISQVTSRPRDFGTYYVSIRAVDWEDHWGPPATFGPFVINGDCNGNGIIDLCDIACDVSSHAQAAGLPCVIPPDFCNVPGCGTSKDCNLNLVPDDCDLANGTSKDCNLNGVPDECDGADGKLIRWAAGDGSWHDPDNWYKRSECPEPPPPPTCDSPFAAHCPATPALLDDVCIDVSGDHTVTYSTGSSQIAGLSCSNNLNIAGGSYPWAELTISEASWIGGSLDLSGDNSVLEIIDRLDIEGIFSWTGSNISYGATLTSPGMTVANGGMEPFNVVRLEGHLVLDGNSTSVSTTGQVYFLGTSSVFEIRPGSTYEYRGSDYIFRGGTGDTFDNDGTLIASTETGTRQIDVFTDNSGLIHVREGTLALRSGSSSTGEFLGDPGTRLEFQNGGHELLASSSIVADNVTFMGGNTVRGTYDVSGATTMGGGHTLTFTSEANIVDYGSSFSISFGTVDFDAILGRTIEFDTLTVGGTGYGTANFNSGDPVKVGNLAIGPGAVRGPNDLTVSTLLTWGGSYGSALFDGPGEVNVSGNMTIQSDSTNMLNNRVLNNAGTATFLGQVRLSSSAVFNNLAGGVIDIQDDGYVFPSDASSVFNNTGTLVKSAGEGTSHIAVAFNNSGIVEVRSGELDFYGASGQTRQIQTGGRTILNGGNITLTQGAIYTIQGGLLTGTGTIGGNVVNTGGAVEPGLSIGTLHIDGNYTQGESAALTVEIGGGPTCTTLDQLHIAGTATLNGTLNVRLIDGCQPALDDTFVVLTSSEPLSGSFTQITGQSLGNGLGFVPVYHANDVTLQVIQCVAPDWDCSECINWADLATFATHWRQSGCTATNWCNGADFSQDGMVNLSDLAELIKHWLESCP